MDGRNPEISHEATKPTKDVYDNEPKNVLFFVFFVASYDSMRRIIQSYKTIFLFFVIENQAIRY